MNDEDRWATMQREKGRGVVRALHLSELRAARAARELAIREADLQLERIARILPNALGAGITLSEVARVTGLSRPTLYQLKARYSDDDRDVVLGVFQTIANVGRATDASLAENLGRQVDEIEKVRKGFLDQGLLDEDFNDNPDDPAMEYWLTEAGFRALEEYRFEGDDGAGEP